MDVWNREDFTQFGTDGLRSAGQSALRQQSQKIP